jgi:hypothetical protein
VASVGLEHINLNRFSFIVLGLDYDETVAPALAWAIRWTVGATAYPPEFFSTRIKAGLLDELVKRVARP